MTKFGLSLLPDVEPAHLDPRTYLRDCVKIAQYADEIGLDYVKMTEHYMHAYGGFVPDPLAYLSAVAATTSDIRLMTGGIQASFHHPIQIAARTAQLDNLSDGRLDVGFARAFLPYEFDAFGVEMDTNTERFRQTVATMQKLGTTPDLDVETDFFSFQGVTSYPPVVQDPHPPIWAAAILTRSSFEWIAESGYNLLVASAPSRENLGALREMIDLYREQYRAPYPGAQPQVTVSVAFHLEDDDAAAVANGTRYLERHWDAFNHAASSWTGRESTAYQGYGKALTTTYAKGSHEAGLAVFGNAESAGEKTQEILDSLAPDTVLWQLDCGGQSYDEMRRSLDLFSGEVRPALSAA